MNLKEELAKMQIRYDRNRLRDIRLDPPVWLVPNDPMSGVFAEKAILLKTGQVGYAHIVQANTYLFKTFPQIDCPAHIVYSTDPRVADDPSILREIAYQLFRYKQTPLENVPDQWREIVRVIADEYDRADFTFSVERCGEPVEIHFIPTIIFRKLLPKRRLCGSLLPVLIAPDCRSVLVLPKRFWTRDFRFAWIRGEI